MRVQKSDTPSDYETYPLFITTQESTIGLFSTACTDCKSTKKFDGSNAVGYKAGKTEATTEWVNVYDKNSEELEAFNF